MPLTTNFIDGVDFGNRYVTKEYLMSVYPDLVPQTVQAGLFVAGYNINGTLGTNDRTDRSSLVQTVAAGNNWKQAKITDNISGGIKRDGTLWVWGKNNYGQLGTNNNTDASSPVQTVAAGNNWKQLSIGSTQCAAIKTDGTLWLWGWNTLGTLGTNDTTHRSSPIQTVSGGTNWKQVAIGASYVGAIKTDGTLWTWGYNAWGQLGTNNTTNYSSPVQTISGGTNWKSVNVFEDTANMTAIKTDGTLWNWGRNQYGELGTNDRTDRSSPIQTIAGGTNWVQASVGSYFSAALKSDGTLWLWGFNGAGQLGTNDLTYRSSPVQTVSGGTSWKSVVISDQSSYAIKTDGTLWVWGNNSTGQLALFDTTNRSSPIQTSAGGNEWKSLAPGRQCIGAIKEFGDDF